MTEAAIANIADMGVDPQQMLHGVSIVDVELRPFVERAVQSQESTESQPNEQQMKDWATKIVNQVYRDGIKM